MASLKKVCVLTTVGISFKGIKKQKDDLTETGLQRHEHRDPENWITC